MKEINVISLDYDNCIWNNHVREAFCAGAQINNIFPMTKKVSEQSILKHTLWFMLSQRNLPFLRSLKKNNENFDTTYFFIGSNRQSYQLDKNNWGYPSATLGSCFSFLKKISEFIGATFIPTLCADIYGNLPHGTSYERATTENYQGPHAESVFDPSKVTLIYAQMHEIANMHPEDQITFTFYDDHFITVLDPLKMFYTENQHLIPHNVILSFYHYEGAVPTLHETFSGTGMIDKNYEQTVKDMVSQAADHHYIATLPKRLKEKEKCEKELQDELNDEEPMELRCKHFRNALKQAEMKITEYHEDKMSYMYKEDIDVNLYYKSHVTPKNNQPENRFPSFIESLNKKETSDTNNEPILDKRLEF